MNRRKFLTSTASFTSASLAACSTGSSLAVDASAPARRVGVIGHTGRGNYGHGLDTVWQKIPGAEIVGVADGDADGLNKELSKLKLPESAGFTSYQEMLEKTKPEFVSVAPRHTDQHRDMCLAAIAAGARGIYVEKPFLRSPKDADDVLAAAEKAGTKIAVAHRNRYHPALLVIDRFIKDGKMGKLLEIRSRGKGDRRGGAEDLWVLGTHVLNLVNFFAGKPRTCSAVMWKDGQPVTKADVIAEGSEGLGALAGNEVHARYEMDSGVIATFDSVANDETDGQGFGLFLIGSKGQINIQIDRDPLAHFLPGNPFQPYTVPRAWQPITTAGVNKEETQPDKVAEVHNHVAGVRDLVESVDTKGREPLCSGEDAALTVEMVCAVFESHRQGGKAVSIPLEQRENALTLL